MTNGRVRNLRFDKVTIVGQGARASAETGIFLKPDTETIATANGNPKPGS